MVHQLPEEMEELDLLLQYLEALYDMQAEDDEVHIEEMVLQELLVIDEEMLDYELMWEVMVQLIQGAVDDEVEIM